LLREWARVLEHKSLDPLTDQSFWHPLKSRNAREAKNHFFALQALRPEVTGVLLLDGDNRSLRDHDIGADGMTILRWIRYEAESYLMHPHVLERFIRHENPGLFGVVSVKKAMDYLNSELPPATLKDPLAEHPFWESTPVGKTLLPSLLREADLHVTKKEYYRIAAIMRPDEIPSEVLEKLDEIWRILGG
jgi:hypothetical protein